MLDELEQKDPEGLDALLREGLREISPPTVSPDFDVRVLRAIQPRRPWWWIDWPREGMSLLVPGAVAALACIATLGTTLWLGGIGPIRFSPNRVVQSTIEAALQAADTGHVSAAALLLRASAPPSAPPPQQGLVRTAPPKKISR